MLKGRCKNCGAPISPRYFIVELLTGLAFLACWLAFSPHGWLALVFCLFLAGLIAATFIDFEHFIIPDEITLGGAVAGLIISMFLPQLHEAKTMSESVIASLLGIGIGGGTVYAVLRLGKLLFGRQKIKLPGNAKVIFAETALHLPDESISYGEIFYRKADVIVFKAKTLELMDRSYKDITVRLTESSLKIGDEEVAPESVLHMEAECGEIVLPREAMGLGDVKFMAAIGAFTGWHGTLFSLMASSVIGSVVGIVLILARKREWSSRMPYGPYIALAAVIWIFGGKKLLALIMPGV
jgi:leader peptidase (prepilin peptidase)/N-methyltransferase